MSRTAVWLHGLFLVVLFLLLMARPAAAQFSFTPLGDLPGGDFRSQAWAVSADGSTVVGNSDSDKSTQAFRWTRETGMVGIGDLGGDLGRSRGFGVSPDGSIVLGESWSLHPEENWGLQAVRWTEETGMVGLGFLPGTTWTIGLASSADGSVIVGHSLKTFLRGRNAAFRWTANEGMTELVPRQTGVSSQATDVSADGNVVIGWIRNQSQPLEAFRWTEDTGMSLLGPGTNAYAISADGSTIVGSAEGGAARWTIEEGWVPIGVPDGYARSVSGDGSIILTSAESPTGGPILWGRDFGLVDVRELLLSQGIDEIGNWPDLHALDMSADGKTIVGIGTNARGQEAWVATIPEPSTFVLAALSAAAAVVMGVRRHRALKFRLFPVVLLILITPLAASAQFSFTPLDGLPPDRAFRSQLWAFPPSGPIVAGRFGSENGTEAYRWTAETGAVGLGDLPGGTFYSWAHGISDDGSVIVGESDYRGPVFQISSSPASQAFRWTAESGMVGLGTLPNALGSCATAASEDGSVVVGVSGSHAFRWTEKDGMTPLVESKPQVYSEAIDVSADGNAVVGTISTQSPHAEAFHWTPESGMTRLGPGSYPYAVSADGSVVVGSLGEGGIGEPGGAYWTAEEGWVRLGLTTPATDVSADGAVIASGQNVWLRDFGWFDLREALISNGFPELENWSRFTVFDISPDGMTLAGKGENPLGQQQGWVATVPEPSTFVLAAMAAAAIAGQRMRRRRAVKIRRSRNRGGAISPN